MNYKYHWESPREICGMVFSGSNFWGVVDDNGHILKFNSEDGNGHPIFHPFKKGEKRRTFKKF